MLRRRRTHRSIPIACVAAAVALVASSCQYYVAAQEHRETSPDTRPWWCHSSGDGGHAGGHGDDDGGAYDGQTKGMLSWDDCISVSVQLDAALAYVNQWPTAGEAEAAGFHQVVPYVAGMGTHHVRVQDFGAHHFDDPDFDPLEPVLEGSIIDETFDPAQPEFLMYDGNGPAARLVGMAWYVRSVDGHPPAGFAGGNDWWHVHPRLCFDRDTVEFRGQGRTDEGCAQLNGVNLHLDDYWMVHAWIVPGWTHEPDVFVNHHPCLLAGGPAPHDDPCWDMAGGHTGH
ncbi:hypothetical protein HC251_12800 [Iamia sp. SCSIO 61187]|uniref:hypothetical protein n=1 Tax=Iamia sp. SCSIO 61187 TaxID=2722752 RepID=UPI001C636335|nr:hypothetical protein [Iamia sp. SCSIO 61187]QYG93219.1 hypothetical protein HC251_12800 [Iamia sp. SCSIO 61187]